eukprot:4536490-Lingulodinium_polyedra.AAC.1
MDVKAMLHLDLEAALWQAWTSEPGRGDLYPAPFVQPLVALARGRPTRAWPAQRRRLAAHLA